ncbi:unnamed protein product [Symbiodinium sp. KB8]|nr:unnamed protein product [Symbiodinium sp. KB8]
MAMENTGKVSYQREDMDKILATFKKWDANGNGSISKSELSNILDHIGVAGKDRQSIFNSIDTSGNGKIEYEEFVQWLYGTMCPLPVRTSALADRYQVCVDSIRLDLEDDPSFSGWFHDASTIRPFLLFSDSLTRKRYFQSSEGLGLKSHLSFDNKTKHEVWQFELCEGQGVDIEICLPKAMQSLRGHHVIGKAMLTLDSIGAQIARGLGSATVFLEVFAASKGLTDAAEEKGEENPNPTVSTSGAAGSVSPRSRRLIARLNLNLTALGPLWAKRNVSLWRQSGLPDLDLDGISKVLQALAAEPDRTLLNEALQMAEAFLANRLQPFRSWTGSTADKELKEVLSWLKKNRDTLDSSSELRKHSSKEFEQLGERLAAGVLSASLEGEVADHELMRSALTFACAVDPHLPEVRHVEETFKSMMRFPRNIKLHDLLHASEADLTQADPKQLGLDLATDGTLPSIQDDVRFGVRDDTAERVLSLLGNKTQLNYRKGVTYARVAMETIGRSDFMLPTLLQTLMAEVRFFRGEKAFCSRSIPELLAAQSRDREALLGRFDVIAAPVRADYSDKFVPLTKATPAVQFFGNDLKEPIGGPGWFWIFHAAAINIGESEAADDFPEYSVPPDPSYRGRRGHNRWLDEDRYVSDMGLLWHRVLHAASHMGIEDMILFPFGMGAFLRNLHKLDNRYSDAAAMRGLRYRIASALFDAAVLLCLEDQAETGPKVQMRLHLCLVDCSLESRSNHNVFIEAAAAKVAQSPALAAALHFHRNCDALELARQLAEKMPLSGRAELDVAVRKVGLLNGANNKQLGNHWFGHGARSAIDENLHRRSGAMCASSLLVNLSTEPRFRSAEELATHVHATGGKCIDLLPFPVKTGKARSGSRIVAKVRVVPYGILGSQLFHGQLRVAAAEPGAGEVVVDPAGLPYIRSGPSGAGGASGQLYKWIGISSHFPQSVQDAITESLQAKFCSYDNGQKNVIHVVGPDFRSRRSNIWADAVDELAKAYASTLKEFAGCELPRLRLLPISSSIFAGPFEKDMPEMTVQALQTGFGMLDPGDQDKILNADGIEMCIFAKAELDEYSRAFRDSMAN